MDKKHLRFRASPGVRHYLRVAAVIAFSASLTAFLFLQAYPYLEVRTVTSRSTVEDTTFSRLALTREVPTRIKIPKLALDTTFAAPLGLNEDGTMEVPSSFDRVGWYKLGAAPGEIGTASILGHVDSNEGPAIFFSLGQLLPGDRIIVVRSDGSEATFAVDTLERYRQEEFPTEMVYAPTPYPSLRLITCSGTYEKGAGRYTHNLVVYAHLVGGEQNGVVLSSDSL